MADAAEPPNNPNVAQPAANPAAAQQQRNRMPGGAQNNLINVRERLFHAIYFKVALMYAQVFPPWMRRTLEYFILFKALIFFGALVYLHMAFIKNPATCLQHVKDWPRDGVLRVEVIPNLEEQRALIRRTRSYEKLLADLQQSYFYGIGPQTRPNYYHWRQYERILNEAGYQLKTSYIAPNETITYLAKTDSTIAINEPPPTGNALKLPPMKTAVEPTVDNDDGDLIYSILFKRSAFLMLLDASGNADEQYIVEYSLEYGHLRLSAATRKRLRIPVRLVQLDPMKDKCFGDDFSKFMLKKVLGYDDLLMASVRVIAEQENNQGYLRNVITGEHYRFVSMWWAAWSSYPTAFAVMLLFTFSISMLLRFSHHQIFVFIVDLLQMLEFNVTARFPIAPLLTVILALVGMEAIMSEFFNDTTTAFYIILIVWIADQYDAICCHTTITKRHWLRFFYLYHFAFYAYHYRFSGQNRNLSLITSWLFIQHSMLFFFHRFELPVISQQAHIIILTRNQPNAAAAAGGAGGGNNIGDGGNVALGLEGVNGGGAGAGAAGGQQGGRRILFFRRQPAAALQPEQAFRLPLLNMLPIRNRPLRWETIQRALLQRGWRGGHAPPVRIQVGNIHRVHVAPVAQQNFSPDSSENAATTAGGGGGAGATTNTANNANTVTTSSTAEATVNLSAAATSTATTSAQVVQTTATTAAQPTKGEKSLQSTESNLGSKTRTTTATSKSQSKDFPATGGNQLVETSQLSEQPPKQQQQQQPQQKNNNTTGNNNIKQPETGEQENKIENKTPPQAQTQQQQEEEEQKQRLGLYSSKATSAKQEIAEDPLKLTAANTQKQSNNKNELLESNDFYQVVADHKAKQAANTEVAAMTSSNINVANMMATKSDQTPQQQLLRALSITTGATGDESNKPAAVNAMQQILQATNNVQPVNQAKIENRDHNTMLLKSNNDDSGGGGGGGASTTSQADEKFDMIDNTADAARRKREQSNNTTTTITVATFENTNNNPQKYFDNLSHIPKDTSPTNSNSKSNGSSRLVVDKQQVSTTNFLANEVSHSSKF